MYTELTKPLLENRPLASSVKSTMATVPIIKIGMMGGGGQGKSALVLQFITGTFLSDYDPTIEG